MELFSLSSDNYRCDSTNAMFPAHDTGLRPQGLSTTNMIIHHQKNGTEVSHQYGTPNKLKITDKANASSLFFRFATFIPEIPTAPGIQLLRNLEKMSQ
jgi:hypothetical protein